MDKGSHYYSHSCLKCQDTENLQVITVGVYLKLQTEIQGQNTFLFTHQCLIFNAASPSVPLEMHRVINSGPRFSVGLMKSLPGCVQEGCLINSAAYFYHQTILKMFVRRRYKEKDGRGTAWFGNSLNSPRTYRATRIAKLKTHSKSSLAVQWRRICPLPML